jgi:hypothetical protein
MNMGLAFAPYAFLFLAPLRETATLATNKFELTGDVVFRNWGFTQRREERKDIRSKGLSVITYLF